MSFGATLRGRTGPDDDVSSQDWRSVGDRDRGDQYLAQMKKDTTHVLVAIRFGLRRCSAQPEGSVQPRVMAVDVVSETDRTVLRHHDRRHVEQDHLDWPRQIDST